MLEHLIFFNKIIKKLFVVDLMIDEEDNALILLSSLSKSYNHIVTTMFYDNDTLIMERSQQPCNRTRYENCQIKMRTQAQVYVWWLCDRGKENYEKKRKSQDSSKLCHFYQKGQVGVVEEKRHARETDNR